MISLEGKTAVVIGAGSGIGEATARTCAKIGAFVSCLDFSLEKAGKTAALITEAGHRAEAGKVDVRDAGSVDSALTDISSRKGPLHTVISTPALNIRKPILDYTPEEVDRVFDLNLKGAFHVLKSAGRIMVSQKMGNIILFSSIRSLVVEPGQGIYAATKAGIVQMVRTMAAELGVHGVRVNAVAPGIVDTPLTKPITSNKEWNEAYASKCILNRWAQPDEIAQPTVFLASDAARYITGSVLFVDGGWTAVDGRYQPPGM